MPNIDDTIRYGCNGIGGELPVLGEEESTMHDEVRRPAGRRIVADVLHFTDLLTIPAPPVTAQADLDILQALRPLAGG